MTQYPDYEIERFENEGGKYFCDINPELTDQELEEIPVIDLLESDSDAGKEVQEHQKS